MKGYVEHENTLRDLLTVYFRHKLIFIVVFITIMLTVYVGLELRMPTYQAYVRILASGKMQKDVEYMRQLGSGSLTETQMSLVK